TGQLWLGWAKNHRHEATLKRRGLLNRGDILDTLLNPLQQLTAELALRNFAPTEHHRYFDLVAFGQKLRRRPRLEVEIVLIDPRLHAYFTQGDLLLVLA